MSVGIYENGQYNKCAGNAKESSATNTTYINTTSGLQATNVQGAIDELNDTLNEKLFQIKNSYTTSNGYVTIRDNRIKSDSIIVSVEQYGDISKLHSLIVSESSHSNGELNITLMTYQGSGYSGSVYLKCVIAN